MSHRVLARSRGSTITRPLVLSYLKRQNFDGDRDAERVGDEQYDVVGAYLNSPLEVTVFMEHSPGVIIDGFDRQNFVYILLKSVYGLKQSRRDWNCFLKKCLENCGLTQIVSDPCF